MAAVHTHLSQPFPSHPPYDYPILSSTSDYQPELNRLLALRNPEVAARSPTPKPIFTLGTRNSKLAMVQTNIVKSALEERWPGIEIRIFGMVRPPHFFFSLSERSTLGPGKRNKS